MRTRLSILCTAVFLLARLGFAQESPQPPPLPTQGEEVAQFAAVDRWMQEFITANKIPGGSLAIARDGEVKLARGYGYADRDALTPVAPDALFRIASVSKPITAVAILKLAEAGKLKLDDAIVDVLGIRPTAPRADYDPWWNRATLRHLLTHTGGWDRNRSGDPMFMDLETVTGVGAVLPLTHRQLIDFQLLRNLDYAPGQRYAYSNFGYCLLGRAIERASGQSYEQYVKEQVFAPLGIKAARIGGSLASQRDDKEVMYYTFDDSRDAAVVGPEIDKEPVPTQYGGWNQELLDSHGGWIASSIDLVRFGSALDELPDGSTRGKLLRGRTVREMFTAQVGFDASADTTFPGYGHGWAVTKLDDTPLICHSGALSCTAAILCRLGDRVWFAALFNLGRTSDDNWLANGLERELGTRIRDAKGSNAE